MNLIDATANSVNTIFAQLVTQVGPGKVVRMAHRLGIRSRPAARLLGDARLAGGQPARDDRRVLDVRRARHPPRPAGGRVGATAAGEVVTYTRAKPRGRLAADVADTSPTRSQAVTTRGTGTGAGYRPADRRQDRHGARSSSTPGSAATRRSSRPACGSATRTRRCRWTTSRATRRSTAAGSRRRSGTPS